MSSIPKTKNTIKQNKPTMKIHRIKKLTSIIAASVTTSIVIFRQFRFPYINWCTVMPILQKKIIKITHLKLALN